jgi:hypothetical protein
MTTSAVSRQRRGQCLFRRPHTHARVPTFHSLLSLPFTPCFPSQVSDIFLKRVTGTGCKTDAEFICPVCRDFSFVSFGVHSEFVCSISTSELVFFRCRTKNHAQTSPSR